MSFYDFIEGKSNSAQDQERLSVMAERLSDVSIALGYGRRSNPAAFDATYVSVSQPETTLAAPTQTPFKPYIVRSMTNQEAASPVNNQIDSNEYRNDQPIAAAPAAEQAQPVEPAVKLSPEEAQQIINLQEARQKLQQIDIDAAAITQQYPTELQKDAA